MNSIDLAVVISHPTQYHAPIFRELDTREYTNLTVYFCDKQGINESYDEGYGEEFSWDIPLLDGYKYEFLSNYAITSKIDHIGSRRINRFNPTIVSKVVKGDHDVFVLLGWNTLTYWMAMVTANLVSKPLVLRGPTKPDPARDQSIIKRVVLKTILNSADAFAAIGTENKQFYRNYGISSDSIFHSPNVVDNEFFQEQANKLPSASKLRRDEDIPENDTVFLFVGRLAEIKRPSVLIEAFDQAVGEDDATLVFVGDGELREKLERKVSRKERSDDVVFAGFQNQTELPRYYKLSDVFVLPSVQDMFPMVIMEAMNFSLPIITTDGVGSVPDLVHEDNGHVIRADDSEALAEVIAEINGQSDLIETMGRNSYRYIQEWNVATAVDGIVKAARYANR